MQVITVRLPDDLAAKVRAHKQATDVPTEAFVRRAIRTALAQLIAEADPEAPKVKVLR
jgi:predicted transcriptional regulator